MTGNLGETFTVASRAMHDFTIATLRCGVTGNDAHPEGAPPAEYIWTHDVPFPDTETPLCTGCCARWRARAQEYPTQAPKRIRSIPKTAVSVAPAGSDPDDPDAWQSLGTADGLTIDWH